MSKEFQIAHQCPHQTIEEPVLLDSDHRTLNTRQPIGAASTVRVLANDEFYIPSSGLLAPAEIFGVLSGPFNIGRDCGTTNQLTITGSTETLTVTLPMGSRTPTDTLVSLLANRLTDIAVVNSNGHLHFTDLGSLGTESRISVTGPAAATLGFTQRGSRGRVVFPGWGLEERQDIANRTNRYPRFNNPIRQRTLFKVTYTVPGERCLRCRGTLVENDMLFNIQQDPILIENENLLYQAVLKILLTDKGSNPFFPEYGANIRNKIGVKAAGAATMLITEDVRSALTTFQNIQGQQAKFQRVSIKERLYAVRSVNVLRDAEDPTVYRVDVSVTNASGEPVNVNIYFTVPGVVALIGSNK